MDNERIALIALKRIYGVGDMSLRWLQKHFGSAEAALGATAPQLAEAEGVGGERAGGVGAGVPCLRPVPAKKARGRGTHVCAAALLPTVPPAFVFGVGRYVVMRNAPNQLRFGYAPCACALCRCAQCGLDF